MYEKNEELVKKKQLGKDALLNYMMSDENAPVILDRLDIYQVVLHIKSTYYLSHKTTALKSGFIYLGYGPTSESLLHQLQPQHVPDRKAVRREVFG